MDEELKREFQRFWIEFFKLRRWRYNQLAELLRVSPDVVTRWLNADYAISPKNVSKLLETGTLQSDEAAQLIRLCLRRVGFSETILPRISASLQPAQQPSDSDNPTILAFSPLASDNTSFHTQILQELTERAVQFNYRVLSQSVPPIPAKRSLREYYADLDEVSGVVAIACHVAGSTWLEECKDADIPLVLIHDSIQEAQLQNMGRVCAIWEELNGLRNLVVHLIRFHKCKQLRMVVAKPSGRYYRQRKIDTIVQTAADNGVTIDEQKHMLPIDEYTYEEGARVARDVIVPDIEVDAVICFYDEAALAVLQTARRYGRQDLKVTGYDNLALAAHFGLTSIDQQRADRAQQAFLEIHTAGNSELKDYPHIHTMRTSLELRASCCP